MNRAVATPLVPVSWGELLDKITILQIKHERIQSPQALANVATELRCLVDAASTVLAIQNVELLIQRLRTVNESLWEIEDSIRVLENERDFGPKFIALARSVYLRNDERAVIKRELNLLLGSELIEEKSYVGTTSALR